jgi:hypothetical protein
MPGDSGSLEQGSLLVRVTPQKEVKDFYKARLARAVTSVPFGGPICQVGEQYVQSAVKANGLEAFDIAAD